MGIAYIHAPWCMAWVLLRGTKCGNILENVVDRSMVCGYSMSMMNTQSFTDWADVVMAWIGVNQLPAGWAWQYAYESGVTPADAALAYAVAR